MSGMIGIYYRDGRPVKPADINLMLDRLAHRGPDGMKTWNEGPVGLGHCMLWTTSESLHEQLPSVSQNGAIILTADARIDNRDDLFAALALNDRPSAETSDSALIVAAYEKWGEHCPERLLGDFAFILWDKRRQVLFGARDHFGVKPFYYYDRPEFFFACASEIKALLCLSEIPRRLNEVRVADYLADIFEDKTSTFYQDIMRLPPAHSVTVSAQGKRIRCYWSLDHSSELRLGSDEEYVVAFRDIFTEAVRCRLRSAFPLGSHLSGGLDSSSVTCLARKLLEETPPRQLHTFSNIFDDVPQCDERPFINAALAQGGYLPHYVHGDRSSPLVDLERVFWHQDEPSIGPNHFLPWELNRAASWDGVRVVLDGFDGDTTVSHGAVRFTELAYAGEWGIFALEANAVSQHFKVSPDGLLQTYGLPCLEELARKQRWLAFASALNQINKYFQASRRDLLWRHGLKSLIPSGIRRGQKKTEGSAATTLLNPDFSRRIGLRERIRVLTGDGSNLPRTVREDQWRMLTSGLFPSVLELSDRSAAAFSIEVRHPFMDKRLIEFCLALPSEQKLHKGWSRIVMRRSMIGILPEAIRWRGGKTDMNPNFLHGLLTTDRAEVEQIVFQPSKSLVQYIDIDVLQRSYRNLLSREKKKIADAMAVWKAVTLVSWLRYVGFEKLGTALEIRRPERFFDQVKTETVFPS